jgi:predicted transcriptional regulator
MLRAMEVHLTELQETRLREFATRIGRGAEELVGEAVDRMLENEARLHEAVEIGRAAARRGELLDHDEVVDRIEQLFKS